MPCRLERQRRFREIQRACVRSESAAPIPLVRLPAHSHRARGHGFFNFIHTELQIVISSERHSIERESWTGHGCFHPRLLIVADGPTGGGPVRLVV